MNSFNCCECIAQTARSKSKLQARSASREGKAQAHLAAKKSKLKKRSHLAPQV